MLPRDDSGDEPITLQNFCWLWLEITWSIDSHI